MPVQKWPTSSTSNGKTTLQRTAEGEVERVHSDEVNAERVDSGATERIRGFEDARRGG